MHRQHRMCVFAAVVLWCGVARAQDASAVSQTVGHGQINWSDKTITATGSGAPNLNSANAAQARLGAERAAKLDAWRNILEAVKGVRVSGGQSAGALMDASPQTKSKVEGLVQGFKVLDTKYYSDGGVDVVVQVSLDGVLLETLVPPAATPAKAAAAGDAGGVTGIVVNAKGLGAQPALVPRFLDEAGKELYGAATVSAEAAKANGYASYTKSLDQAMKHPKVGAKALVIKATKLGAAGGSDLVLNAEEAAKLAKVASILASGKVIIVTD